MNLKGLFNNNNKILIIYKHKDHINHNNKKLIIKQMI